MADGYIELSPEVLEPILESLITGSIEGGDDTTPTV